MTAIALFRNAPVKTAATLAFAERIRADGHVVTVLDPYEGRIFATLDEVDDLARRCRGAAHLHRFATTSLSPPKSAFQRGHSSPRIGNPLDSHGRLLTWRHRGNNCARHVSHSRWRRRRLGYIAWTYQCTDGGLAKPSRLDRRRDSIVRSRSCTPPWSEFERTE